VIEAGHSYHPVSEKTCRANHVSEVVMLFWENEGVEGSEPYYGCGLVSAKCPLELGKHACIDLCFATAAEAMRDRVHNCRCPLAGCVLSLCAEADF
jgi:hypothetical protein